MSNEQIHPEALQPYRSRTSSGLHTVEYLLPNNHQATALSPVAVYTDSGLRYLTGEVAEAAVEASKRAGPYDLIIFFRIPEESGILEAIKQEVGAAGGFTENPTIFEADPSWYDAEVLNTFIKISKARQPRSDLTEMFLATSYFNALTQLYGLNAGQLVENIASNLGYNLRAFISNIDAQSRILGPDLIKEYIVQNIDVLHQAAQEVGIQRLKRIQGIEGNILIVCDIFSFRQIAEHINQAFRGQWDQGTLAKALTIPKSRREKRWNYNPNVQFPPSRQSRSRN